MLGRGCEDEDLAVSHVLHWSPPLHSRGPFTTFLEVAPEAALGAVVRLVNFATGRWAEREAKDPHGLRKKKGPPRPVEVVADGPGPAARWQGDSQVYFWYLGDPRAPTR